MAFLESGQPHMHKAWDVQTICLVTKMPQNYNGLKKKLWKQDLFTETFPQLSSLGVKKIDTNMSIL